MSKKKVLNKTERLAIAKEQHIKWLLSIGVKLDKNGKVINNFKGYPMPDLSVRNSILRVIEYQVLVRREY